MSNQSGRMVMVLTAAGAAIAIPVLLGSLWSAWRSTVEARTLEMDRASQSLPPPVEPPPPAPPPEPEVPTFESRMLALGEFQLKDAAAPDAEPKWAERVDLVGDGSGLPTAARVDLQRDGTIDEVWHFRPELYREVGLVPGGEPKRLVRDANGAWVPMEGLPQAVPAEGAAPAQPQEAPAAPAGAGTQ